jgi:RimJ/RimL family protein N-acetyltransferase
MTPRIETPRLVLRPFIRVDAPDVFAYASNPNVSRYTTWQTHRTIADSEAFIEMVLGRGLGQHAWAITSRSDSSVIGAIEFGLKSGVEAQVDYVLAEPFWNRGLMTEAARAVLDYGVSHYPTVKRVIACAMTENIGSHRVMEKCGFRFEEAKSYFWSKCQKSVELRQYVLATDKASGDVD